MKIVDELKKRTKDLIINGNLIDALKAFNQFNSDYKISNSDFENHYISISGTFFSNRKRYNEGNLSNNEYNIIESKTIVSFLALIDDLDGLSPENVVRRIVHSDSSTNDIVVVQHFDINQIFYTIGKIINTDDKINDLKITIDQKKIEVSKSIDKDRIKELNDQIDELKNNLETEKNNYKNLKNRYDELEEMYQKQNESTKDMQIPVGDNIHYGGEDNDLLIKLTELRNSHDTLSDQITQLKQIVKEKIDDSNNKQINNFSIIIGYLDDLNRKISQYKN